MEDVCVSGELSSKAANFQLLGSMTAAEIMNKDVLLVYEGWSVKRLAQFFKERKITGAPVISSDHKLVGVVSVTDILNFEFLADRQKGEMISRAYFEEVLGQQLLMHDLAQYAEQADQYCTVNSIMTPEVISVSEDAGLPQVAKTLRENSIHRLFVTKDEKITGVISATDLLSPLADLCSSPV